MFTNLNLLPTYISTENNIAEDFYNPVLKNSIKFDRISGYFSSRALAKYAQGLEYFARNGFKYRLIISKDISESDFLEIKAGYFHKREINTELLNNMHDKLELFEEMNLSNLAYLISIGIVDLKIAFKIDGIFHDKCGIFWDAEGNILSYRGSNNETYAAIENNYEAFNVTCSWIDEGGFYKKGIDKSIIEFNTLWENKHNDIIVMEFDDIVKSEILKFSKGELIVEQVLLRDNALILDFNEQLILRFNSLDIDEFINSGFYKIKLKRNVEKIVNKQIYFNKKLTYIDFQKINQLLNNKMIDAGIDYFATKRLIDYIDARNLHIESRSRLGIDIKNKNEKIFPHFEAFSDIVTTNMSRELREQQMWDAFYMYAMAKCSNFSVPGSGKTASVLGVYSFLKSKGIVNRIIMIGPKNAFGTWIDEFKTCFSGIEDLKVFNIHDSKYKGSNQIKRILKYDSLKYNLFLLNYESLGIYKDYFKELIGSNSLLVFDEIHKAKRFGGQYANYAIHLSEKSSYTIALTGTPIPNSYLDMYNILKILYNDEYDEYFGFELKTLRFPNDDDMMHINNKLQPFFCRTTKNQLGVTKANADIEIFVETTSAECKLFEIICSKYMNNKLAMFIRILQLESNPSMILEALKPSDFEDILDITDNIDDSDYVDYSIDVVNLIDEIGISSKMQECIRLVSKLVNEKKKVIVWCIFKKSINDLEKYLNEKGIKAFSIYGEVELEDRFSILNDFQKGNFDVLITNPHTLAESISLHKICHDAIYYEYSYNLVHLLQSKDRIHRLGLENNQYTQYYYLKDIYYLHDGEISIDDKVHKRLEVKEKIMLDAIDNNILEKVSTTDEDLENIFFDFYK